jgi:hypothetical protein
MQLDELRIGEHDRQGREILDVMWSTENYAVYSHRTGISPQFSDDAELAHRQRAAFAQIGPLLSTVNALRTGSIRRAESINREISRAISQSLEGHVEHAHDILVDVQTRLHKLRSLYGRLQYQFSCFAVTLLAVTGLGAALFFGSTLGNYELSPLLMAQIATCGALGGFLSVTVGIRRLEIDPDGDWKINVIAGGSRIVIAMIGAVFVYFAIVSNLLLGLLPIESSTAGVFAVSIAAVFIESFVPNPFLQAGTGENGS